MIDTTVRRGIRAYAGEFWQFRELLLNLIHRDMKAQTKQSFLGYAWILIPILFQTGLFTILFRVILDIDMGTGVPYPVFLYCTLLPWQMFAGMLTQGAGSLAAHAGLIRQVYFPKEMIVISSMTAEMGKALLASVALVALLIYYRIGVGWNLAWVPVLVTIQLMFTFGLVLLLSVANAVARDVSKGIGVIVSLWMYASPVVYPLEKVPVAYREVYLLNPMAILIQGYKRAILENAPPDAVPLAVVAAASAVLCGLAYHLFKKAEGLVADIA